MKKFIFPAIFIIIVIFLFFYYYYGIFHYQYLVPPGDDPIRHMTEAVKIGQEGMATEYLGSLDPPLFHVLLVILSYFTKTTIVSLTIFFTAFLVILASLSLYFLCRRLFRNNLIAIFSPIFLILFTPQPANIYNGGTYLNIFAAFYLMIFAFAFLPKVFLEKQINWKNIVLSAIFFGGVMLSHSLSAVYFALTFAILLIIIFLLKFANFVLEFFRKKIEIADKIYFKNLLILCLVLLFVIPFIWPFYFNLFFQTISAPVLEFFDIGIEEEIITTAAVGKFSIVPSYGYYGRAIGKITLGLALIFMPFVYITAFKFKKISFSLFLILSWGAALFFGSRTSFFLLPSRFGRDLVVPLIIFITFLLFYYLRYLRFQKFIKYLILILLVLSVPEFFSKGVKYNSMVRLQKSDEKAISWIKKYTDKNDVILIYPPTITMGGWGSFVNLLTERKTVDGWDCKNENTINKKNKKYRKCDQIYNPESYKSKKFYQDNSVDYVYAGKKILGNFAGEAKIDWNYQDSLQQAKFLEKVAEFEEDAKLGKVMIFKVTPSHLFD